MKQPLLSVQNLQLSFAGQPVINGISFDIFKGETFALVGESGSGKSLAALSVLRLHPAQSYLQADAIQLGDIDILRTPEAELCQVRGQRVAMIFQDPMSSLNPVMTIGQQIAETIQIHFSLNKQQCIEKVLSLLEQVGIPDRQRRINEYPHQLSGGQRQRIMIAIALAGEPDLLIADEPTTALDVTIQAQILQLLKKIQQENGMALWLISHDLALVSNMADQVAVMQSGLIVEVAENKEIFTHAKHQYTQKLLNALPDINCCTEHGKPKADIILKLTGFKVHYPIRKGLFKRVVDYVKAVDDVSFTLEAGKTLALVGESGCGKTTLGKGLLNLIPSTAGQVEFAGVDLASLSREELREQRSAMQIVFQDPFAAMNPRMLVLDIIAEGVRAMHKDINEQDRIVIVTDLLKQVGLDETALYRCPHEFSGGQRQRICIARALAVKPKLIVCDEPTSALDVSVQKQIIELLKSLQKTQNISYLFITHDLAVVAEIADEIAVMYQGKIVEHGPVNQVLRHAQHSYTQKLLSAVPVLVQ
ncbi:peptide/nickel transport system ATP-binding protein [Bathymodiolus platifrons methanotrophic gill symbiont]|uniref:ABC transporter ATP-binding protein n=1 Tax=Bathymodiolus platifrons methanotrophic gill symbiont TaxID=113268 RepID=UPI0011CC4A4F|nr:dipeptide ABC transporter ATP-binding protein [Bathymodiolus platifrons methanotrophic gill symbiont]TXK98902.1 ABC transporter ATP-binding protein [Methylococcaceae bacterium HT1]TXL16524.1 ABC transporter ATP-binding protein [Methylococcaceae bacterium HT3]GFO75283.1 peptide/nickel transport system ATP-binding protein [Bathymodiolus platifrons methanotrophic gill symbiont]